MSLQPHRALVFDVETYPLADAELYLEPVQPARNLKDPIKIAADIASRTADRLDKLALDWNVSRIAALAWWTAPPLWTTSGELTVHLGRTEDEERTALSAFWKAAQYRTLIGFNVKGFDLRVLIQRSRYLGVRHPRLDLGRYSRARIVDLFLELTFNEGHYDQGAMRRTLHAFCKRFGIPVDDDLRGADMPALAAAGEWMQVIQHIESDVLLTRQLAERLGLLESDDDAAEEGGGHDALAEVQHGQASEGSSDQVRDG